MGPHRAQRHRVDPRSRVLVVSHGFFGDRWGEIARANGYDVTVLSSEPGDVVPLDSIVEELSRGGYGAMLVSHVETSTGVRADLVKLAPVARTLTPRQTRKTPPGSTKHTNNNTG